MKAEALKCRYCGSDLTQTPGSAPREEQIVAAGADVDIAPGTVLAGKYKILRLVGQGGMGHVFEAREIDFDLGRTVAIKVLPRALMTNERLLRRFEEEVRISARMDHPNIVPIYLIGKHGACLFFVMKYIHGKTVKELLHETGPLPEPTLMDIARQIARAVAHIHREGTIHRDIKSNNIMIDSGGHAILMDFGIAKSNAQAMLTTSGEILGTAPYMSPEQWDGQIDHRSDIYSLGVVMFELATGSLPFQADRIPELMHAVLSDPVPRVRERRGDLSENMAGIIERCLQKRADDRFASMDEMRRALGDAPAPLTTPIRPPEPLADTVPLAATHPTISAGDLTARARQEADAGHLTNALRILDQALARTPADETAAELRARILEAKNDTEKAIVHAHERLAKGDHDEARAILDSALSRMPSKKAREMLDRIDEAQAREQAGRAAPPRPNTTAPGAPAPSRAPRARVLYIAAGAAAGLLLLAFVVFPLAAPYAASRTLEEAGDLSFRAGMLATRGVGSFAWYERAKRLRSNDGPLMGKQERVVLTLKDQARRAMNAGDYDRAYKIYGTLYRLRPNDWDVAVNYNRALERRNKSK
ncbi:protein kinase [bacterium]|nr:protein kinase [bacterium]